ncbi:MAG: FGGY-family carbohydrate kinase, partial [Verrucomicrobiia bacterium]
RFDLDERDAAANCRAVVEAQMMSMRLHSQWMKVAPKRIYATGGASGNTAILQVMADVMNCPVLRIEVAKSAALGAALRAAHGYLVAQASALAKRGKTVGRDARATDLWEEVVAGFTDPVPDSEIKPNPKAARVYDKLIEKYAECERRVLQQIK